ncbi:putative tail assembly chaperone [Cyanophage S-2L]|nr:putative tail assembly chaperone [Cyanophage S-2L]
MRAIDLLKAESNLQTLKRHLITFRSGATLEMYTTPVTLAERRQAAENAKSDEQLEVNLGLLILKAKDANGQPLFAPGDLAQLRRSVSAEYVADLVNALYSTPALDEGEASDPKPSSPSSGKTNSSSSN